MSNTKHDRAWADYGTRFRREVMPRLLGSKIFLAVWDDDEGPEQVQFATNLGMMLIYDKPILLVVPTGVAVPPKLRLVADAVIDDADMADPRTQERLAEALLALGVSTGKDE